MNATVWSASNIKLLSICNWLAKKVERRWGKCAKGMYLQHFANESHKWIEEMCMNLMSWICSSFASCVRIILELLTSMQIYFGIWNWVSFEHQEKWIELNWIITVNFWMQVNCELQKWWIRPPLRNKIWKKQLFPISKMKAAWSGSTDITVYVNTCLCQGTAFVGPLDDWFICQMIYMRLICSCTC